MPHWIMIALLAMMAGLLLYAAWGDLRARIIPNPLNAAIACVAILWWLAAGLPPMELALRIGIALAVFALFTVFFALGMMGGGDVKMIGALAIWLPFDALVRMLAIMAVAGGVVTIVLVARHRLRRAEGQPEIPYGVAIAAAGLWEVAQRYLYHFG